MTSGYQHVTHEQRYVMWALRRQGATQRSIAATLGVSASTVSRELHRNSGKRRYRPLQAQRLCDERQAYRHRNRTFTLEMQQLMEDGLRNDRSPEQLVGKCQVHRIACVSMEGIYQHIWHDKGNGGVLYRHLRSGHSQRRKR